MRMRGFKVFEDLRRKRSWILEFADIEKVSTFQKYSTFKMAKNLKIQNRIELEFYNKY